MNDHKRVETEKRIAGKLVAAALAAGYAVSVHDGEEYPIKRSTDKAAIIAAMFSTDSDSLVMRTAAGERVGGVLLVYGNGDEVISDYTDNAAIGALVAATETKAA